MAIYKNSPPIVTNGLVLHLDVVNSLSYTSGSNFKDLSGNKNVATFPNSISVSSNNVGILSFVSANSQYALVSNSIISSPTNQSVFVWFYPTNAGQIVAELGQSAINTSYHDSNIEISSGGVISFSCWQGSLTNKVTSTQSFNSWYYLGFTYSGTLLTAYINGINVGTTTFTRSAPSSLYYGLCSTDSTNMGTQGYAGGSLGSFKVYNRALSASEVSQNFNALKSRYLGNNPVTTTTTTAAGNVLKLIVGGTTNTLNNPTGYIDVTSDSADFPNYSTYTSLDATGCINMTGLYDPLDVLTTATVTGCTKMYYLDLTDNSLTSTAVDNILIQMANNIAGYNGQSTGKTIRLHNPLGSGTNQPRTSASNTAVTNLTSAGWSVTTA